MMTSPCLSSHYTAGLRTVSMTGSISVPPYCGAFGHQHRTEGFLPVMHPPPATPPDAEPENAEPALMQEDQQRASGQQVIPLTAFTLLCQWETAEAATGTKDRC